MKRILSIILCVAMLTSMVAMSVNAFGAYVDEVNANSENVMTITTDKETYQPGDTVVITAAMDSIWGDPEIVDDFETYEGMEMPGAYGMMGINTTVIYDPSVFTPKAAKSLLGSSTILNADMATFNATSVLDAKASGSVNAKITADTGLMNADGDAWGFLNGSGDLWTWNLTINANAEDGTYYLPVGPYMIYRGAAGTSSSVQFDEATDPQGREWHWLGQSSSYGNTTMGTESGFDINGGASAPTAVRYETGYTGGSRVVKGAEYECSYIKIVIGDGGDEPIDPPVVTDPMELELTVDGSAFVPGDIVTATLNVKNNTGIEDASLFLNFDNLDLKLTGITAGAEAIGTPDFDLANANKQGSFEAVGQDTEVLVFFNDASTFSENGTIATFTFEVLATAEGGDSAISVSVAECELDATANVNVAGDHAHNFEDVIVPGKCGVNGNGGSESKVCDCGLNYLIASTGKPACVRDEASKVVVPATCTTDEYTTYYCANCGGVESSTKTLDKLGHDLITITVTEQTCTSAKVQYDKCQREGCKYETEKVEVLPAIGHKNPDGSSAWGDRKVVIEPTTYSVGYYGTTCSICGEHKTDDEIPMRPIVYGDVNMDDEINLNDITTMLKSIAKWQNIPKFSPENADVVVDGRVNTIDVTRLLQKIAGWNVVLGQGGTVVG